MKRSANMGNPVAMPNQNPRNPFPAWRLPKGMIKASQEELEKSIESCERWEWFGGVLVFIGVAAAVAIAGIHPKYDSFLEQWGSAIADGLVAAGVAIEIKFGQMAGLRQHELKRRSDIIVGNANIRAAEALQKAEEEHHARVKLEAQLSPRTLTKEQYETLLSLSGKVEQVNITSSPVFEAVMFAAQIGQALFNAGITVKICNPRFGMVWLELCVVIPKPIPDFDADPLYAAFKMAGLSVGCGDRSKVPMIDLPSDIPVIMVGEKAPPCQEVPPYVFTLPPNTGETG
jgi:hypothetical protein